MYKCCDTNSMCRTTLPQTKMFQPSPALFNSPPLTLPPPTRTFPNKPKQCLVLLHLTRWSQVPRCPCLVPTHVWRMIAASTAVFYYTSSYFTWWDFGGMTIQDPKIGGIDPNSCHPNPRPTTLVFFLTYSYLRTKNKSWLSL